MTWTGYRDWWGFYDAGGLADQQALPERVIKAAQNADTVISSSLRRAYESAEMASGRDPDVISDELVEASLPPPHMGPFKLRPRSWGTIARVFWYFGWTDGLESHADAKRRAHRASKLLQDHASGGKFVFVAAHGWFNRMLKGELERQGWKCTFQNGDMHWSMRRFERKSVNQTEENS